MLQWVQTYEVWLDRVKDILQSMNMPLEDWQSIRQFDFKAQYDAGTTPDEAAMKAKRYWWHQQHKSLKQDCQLRPDCWLPRGHQAKCQPVS